MQRGVGAAVVAAAAVVVGTSTGTATGTGTSTSTSNSTIQEVVVINWKSLAQEDSKRLPVHATASLQGRMASCKWLSRLLGGSWVDITGVISPLIWVITIVTLLITPLITAGFRDRSGFQRALTPAEQCPSGRRRQGVQRVQGLGRGGVIVFGG